MHLSVALQNSTLRRILSFLSICLQVSLADEELVAVDFDFATLLSSPFLFLHPFRHRFRAAYQDGISSAASRAEMADVEHMKKIVPSITCEITFGRYVCELLFCKSGKQHKTCSSRCAQWMMRAIFS